MVHGVERRRQEEERTDEDGRGSGGAEGLLTVRRAVSVECAVLKPD